MGAKIIQGQYARSSTGTRVPAPVVVLSLLPLPHASVQPIEEKSENRGLRISSSHQTLYSSIQYPESLVTFSDLLSSAVLGYLPVHLPHFELPSHYLAARDSVISPLLYDSLPFGPVSRKQSGAFFWWDGFWFAGRKLV